MISCRPIPLSIVSAILIAVFVLPAQNVAAQSVLLSNLKSSEQMDSPARPSSPVQRSGMRKLPSPNDAVSDPFLGNSLTPASPPTVGSILQSSGVDDTLLATAPIANGAHEDLDALLWLRTSVEYDALTRQAFAAATEKLGQALVDPNWEALVEVERSGVALSGRPPCVIVDVDETMLDNSAFQMERIQSDTEYDTEVWNEFVRRRASPAIEGAVDFAQACRASGVKVFFVTNREAKVEAATRHNLVSEGLMDENDPDLILSKNERNNWTSDKASRRRFVAQKYRVLLLVGDDLNDFLSAKNLTIQQRNRLFLAHQENWGQRWFVLPNPNYGSWEQATIGNDYRAPLKKKRELKLQTLGGTP